mmetsp:Transcript_27136/g.63434  ORF Transcript_27136/g.63434 Transcript_27136/m.63434 type:complete len:83 (-) Transcript_27136:393-641(-)
MGPDQKGFEAMRRWLVGETAEQRQQWRAEVLATTKEDFNEFGKRLATMIDDGNVVAFGSKKAFSDANSELDAKDQIEMIEIL